MALTKLQKLKKESDAYNKKWVEKGGKLTKYFCSFHKGLVDTNQPKSKEDTGEKGYWDSATDCTECGAMNFVCVWPNGKTISKPMQAARSGKFKNLSSKNADAEFAYNPGHKEVREIVR